MSTRYYCGNEKLQSGSEIRLPEDESRHLLKVMRGRPGDEIVVFGAGTQHRAKLLGSADRGIAVISVGEPIEGPRPLSVSMTFIIPWIKGGKTEFLVQKLTELGVQRLIVFQARREVVKGDQSKLDRLRKVAIEACKQCERADVPEIAYLPALSQAIADCESIPVNNRFLLHERQSDIMFSGYVAEGLKLSREIVVASGPEGGWHPDEVESVSGKVVLVSLGQRILRAETAPVAAAVAALTIAGDI